MATVLAFDFGINHIGVASGNSQTMIVTPRGAIRARDGIPDQAALLKLIEEWQPKQCAVGLPLNADGSEQEMTRRARKFGNRLGAQFKLKVSFVDERYTSASAKERIFSCGGFRALQKGKEQIDGISAAEILEQFFAQSKERKS